MLRSRSCLKRTSAVATERGPQSITDSGAASARTSRQATDVQPRHDASDPSQQQVGVLDKSHIVCRLPPTVVQPRIYETFFRLRMRERPGSQRVEAQRLHFSRTWGRKLPGASHWAQTSQADFLSPKRYGSEDSSWYARWLAEAFIRCARWAFEGAGLRSRACARVVVSSSSHSGSNSSRSSSRSSRCRCSSSSSSAVNEFWHKSSEGNLGVGLQGQRPKRTVAALSVSRSPASSSTLHLGSLEAQNPQRFGDANRPCRSVLAAKASKMRGVIMTGLPRPCDVVAQEHNHDAGSNNNKSQ